MGSLEEINRELAAVVDELSATPTTDFAARHRLRSRQDELRKLASEFRADFDATRPTEYLVAELEARESQLVALHDAGMDLITQSGGGSGTGGSYVSAAEGGLNKRIREANDGPEIKARIARLREILDRRAGSPKDA